MKTGPSTISIVGLLISLIPVILVGLVFFKWNLGWKKLIYATSRMLGQLILIGFFLGFIFKSDSVVLISSVLFVMLVVASWISLGPIEKRRRELFVAVIISLLVSSIFVMSVLFLWVLEPGSWENPRYLVPLAGMVLSNSMNAVSLSAERFYSEIRNNVEMMEAKRVALNTALIPIINSFFAVGLVSFPGMMTGQILSGVSPLIASRYQIMVMSMILGSIGISTFLFLNFLEKKELAKKALSSSQASG